LILTAGETVWKTPLEDWIKTKIGLDRRAPLTREAIDAYQLKKLRETIDTVREASPFYKRLFAKMTGAPLHQLEDLADFPFTTVDDIQKDPYAFLCVSQDEIARVVSLQTSGTTGRPKRLFFTEADLELTIDFFHHGMSTMVSPGDRVLILMPGNLPYSVGDLLVRGLSRLNVAGIVHGPVTDPEAVARMILEEEIDCLVGIPVQVLGVARSRAAGNIPSGRLKSILLSADYVPSAIIQILSDQWGCRVYQHYGLTETGYGGAVECAALAGYHVREADLLFEIVAPETGRPVRKGDMGEVVITTLTRQAMPLVRYRTGDLARFIPEACPCGTALERIGRIEGRLGLAVPISDTVCLSSQMLDDVVFKVRGVSNYRMHLDRSGTQNRLTLSVFSAVCASENLINEVRCAVLTIPGMTEITAQGILRLDIRLAEEPLEISSGPIKRTISIGKL
jgi:phenylacetate-CoA ligase